MTRAIEAGPAGKGTSLNPAQVRDIVKREVDAALRKRLGEEAAKAKATAGKRGARGPAKEPAKKTAGGAARGQTAKLKDFNDMLAEMVQICKAKRKATKAAGVKGMG